MNCKWVYVVLCVLGAGLPYSQFIPWVMENGLQMKSFVQQLFANRVGGFFGLDVLASLRGGVVPLCIVGRPSHG